MRRIAWFALALLILGVLPALALSSAHAPQAPSGPGRVYVPLALGGVWPTPTPSPTPYWDPRLTQRGAFLIPAQMMPGQGYWQLVWAVWYAENEPPFAGQHHILMDTLDSNGVRQTGVLFRVTTLDGLTELGTATTEAKPGEPYAANFPMWEVAPFYRTAPADGAPADAVSGMGMGSIERPTWKIHTSYGLVWRWTVAPLPAPTPTETPAPTATPTASVTATPTETATPTATLPPTPVETATATSTVTPPPSATATETATLAPTATPTPTPSATASPTATPTSSPTPSDWPQLALTPVASGLAQPVHVTHAGDNSGRLFVVEQGGRIRIVEDGVLRATPFLDISGRVSCCGEQGLLSVAFPPGYTAKRYFYVNYTDLAGATVIARFRLTTDSNVADPASEEIVLTVAQPYSNHNGGQIAFGPNDGYLYVGMGDGGSAGDPGNRAQNPAELLGKLLRIDVETGSPITYTIPATNPFTQTAPYRGEIWAMGLRNPWRFAFDRATGDLYIGDVGQDKYEEVDYQPAAGRGGQNYGWRIMEGAHCYNPADCAPVNLTLPIVEYDHGLGCSITGGTVYRGAAFARMRGMYLYADYCSGRIWGLRHDGGAWRVSQLARAQFNVTTFGEDEAGEVYLADTTNGVVYRVVDGGNP
ncbi:MAG: PQQ-dependent sugar dehydrogenase [Chloroflexi bacterium]|nr:PQQ-dependent sugar dehydrogenase [Chloroflexota bacterium]